MAPVGPVTQAERINSLDTLRGFALLGILPANILVFGLYFAAGNDPTVAGGATGLNLASWALFHILVEGKMRCLFSMVFGASVILLTGRVEERTGASAADIYYRRNLWLLVFGLVHSFLFFWGDILFPYALCALILFPFRKLPAKKLLLIGGLFIAFKAGWLTVEAFRQVERRDLAAAALVAEKTGRKPTEEQAEAKRAADWWDEGPLAHGFGPPVWTRAGRSVSWHRWSGHRVGRRDRRRPARMGRESRQGAT